MEVPTIVFQHAKTIRMELDLPLGYLGPVLSVNSLRRIDDFKGSPIILFPTIMGINEGRASSS